MGDWTPRYRPGHRLVNSRGAIREIVETGVLSASKKKRGYLLRRITENPNKEPAETRPIGGLFFSDLATVENGGTYKCLEQVVETALCA